MITPNRSPEEDQILLQTLESLQRRAIDRLRETQTDPLNPRQASESAKSDEN